MEWNGMLPPSFFYITSSTSHCIIIFLIHKRKGFFIYFWTGSEKISLSLRFQAENTTGYPTRSHPRLIRVSRKWTAAHAVQPQLFSSTSCHGNMFLPSPCILSLLSSCMQQQRLGGATNYIEEVVKPPHSLQCWRWSSSVAAAGASAPVNTCAVFTTGSLSTLSNGKFILI